MNMLKTIGFVCFFAGTNQLVAQTPTELQSAFKKSYALEQENNYGNATKELLTVYTEDSYELNLRIGWLYFLATDYVQSINYYTKAIQLKPDATEPLWGIAGVYGEKQDWVTLEKIYLSILKLDVNNSFAHYYLGSIYYYRKNYTTAKTHFDESLALNPFDYDILLMSAWTNYFLGKTSEASLLFNKVLLNYPDDTAATEGLSLIK